MARPESQAVAGYFPTPSDLIPRIASLIELPDPKKNRWTHHTMLDPAAGDGAAIEELRRALTPGWSRLRRPVVVAVELERERARACERRFGHRNQVHHGDAFSLNWSPTAAVSLLFLNPPYDHDAEHGRIEEKFLRRFTAAVAPGGVLVFVVPARSLPASAETIAEHYDDVRCWRFPDPEFAAFGQVVLLARRRRRPNRSAAAREEVAELVRSWADPARLWPLPETGTADRLAVPTDNTSFRPKMLDMDVRATLAEWEPCAGQGYELPLDELIGRRYVTAMPPKPAHLALAVAAGIFNGHRLEPNDPAAHPALLLKGRFERERVEIEEKFDDKTGQKVGSVQVEQPALELTALRLDTYEMFDPKPGATPTGSEDLAAMNTADIMERYGSGLAALMERQFVPLHHPADRFALPKTARAPFACQANAIRAALRVLGTGENPWLVAEVGTGKTQCALTIAAALSSEHRAATQAAMGDTAQPLPEVRRTLVMCPPHLVGSWIDQAAAVLPGWRVVEVDGISDLHREADLYVMSRERAKLGATIEGVTGRCPGCGAHVEKAARTCASRRLRCQEVTRRPANVQARAFVRMLAVAHHVIPADETVEWGVETTRVRLGRPSGRLDAAAVRRVLADLLDNVAATIDENHGWQHRGDMLTAIEGLARAAEAEAATSRRLLEIGKQEKARSWGPHSEVRRVGLALADENPEGVRPDLAKALDKLADLSRWWEDVCGEPLFTNTRPRRIPLAKYIVRHMPRRFSLFVLDESHEFNQSGTAQSKAAHRLLALGRPTLLLSGSVMGGYSSSLFGNMWAASSAFRRVFDRGDRGAFVDRYGYRRLLVTVKDRKATPSIDYGSRSDRELCNVKRLGEAPGILPGFLMSHLLPVAAMIHKSDLDSELPAMTEDQRPLDATADDRSLLAEYFRLEGILLRRIRSDMYTERTGKLLGALVELPSYLDRCTEDQGEFVISYPSVDGEEGEVVAIGRQFPSTVRTTKERWLVERLRELLARGDRVMVFLRHTGTAKLPRRLLDIIATEVDPSVKWLDAKKVSARKREAWIEKHVNQTGCRILLVNPVAVCTGLNNLVSFNHVVWYQTQYSALVYRQANGRIHRIGQDRPCAVDWPFYPGTAQEAAVELVAAKVTASEQVDGLTLQGALEACGADPESRAAAAMNLALGQAIYEALIAANEKR